MSLRGECRRVEVSPYARSVLGVPGVALLPATRTAVFARFREKHPRDLTARRSVIVYIYIYNRPPGNNGRDRYARRAYIFETRPRSRLIIIIIISVGRVLSLIVITRNLKAVRRNAFVFYIYIYNIVAVISSTKERPAS